ncbi:DNA polymerase III subunit delta [uncultured Limosilactobacillus sp.]|uniref:DNA polymerase III subunit delta n=1 Tax=uncultured Limosilactobacillus sp. TaxID=2837629 RepID=UPI0025D4443F|nr:DNA polymerase III subunit delta [uncultured Limosilactobacillus sp.]
MDTINLKKQLNDAPPAPVYLVLGTQSVMMTEAKEAFLSIIPKEERVMNVGSYDLEEESLSSAINDAMSAPFFGEKRLVFLNKPTFLTTTGEKGKLKQNPNLLKDYLDHPQLSTVLVVMAPYEKLDGRKGVVKDLKKAAVIVEAQPLKEQAARENVQRQVRSAGFHFADGSLNDLVERTNADYSLMVANLKKLMILNYQTKEISREAVQKLVPQSLDSNVFDLVTAVLNHHQKRSLDLYRQLLDSEQQPLQINAVLVSQFRLLLQLKILSARGLSQGTLANRLKVHPYRVKLGLQTVHKFSLIDLMNAYLGLVRCERALKTTSRSPELLFQLFMLQYSQQVKK